MKFSACLLLLLALSGPAIAKSLRSSRALALDRFLDLDEANAFVDSVVSDFPQLASLQVIGQTSEGRDIRVLKLSNGGAKPAVWIDALFHGKEWVSLPVALNAINELTENYAANQALLDAVDFYFLPIVSPDSYAYSWSDERLWRKNRETNAGSDCLGVDPNRNFDAGFAAGGGELVCSDNYEGPAPDSTAEAKAVGDFLLATTSITTYLSLHSFGPALVFPPGYSSELVPNNDELLRVATEAASAIAAVRGTQYEVGATSEVVGFKYGQSTDFAYEVAGIPLTYTLELVGGGPEGYDPPASDILPVATETFAAIKVIAQNAPAARRA